jgi:hypothetical protein
VISALAVHPGRQVDQLVNFSLSFKQCKTPMQIEFTVYLGHRIPRKIGPARSYTTRPERAFKRAPTGPRRGVERSERTTIPRRFQYQFD